MDYFVEFTPGPYTMQRGRWISIEEAKKLYKFDEKKSRPAKAPDPYEGD